MNADFEILFEDNHCLAVNKPAGLLTQGDASGDTSLFELVKADLKVRYAKPGNVYLGLLHRLDRPTSGVVLLAKTSKAASRLSDQFRRGDMRKTYWAVVEGSPAEEAGEWTDFLVKDRGENRVRVVERDWDVEEEGGERESSKRARVSYRVLDRRGRETLLELRPETGRSHQLRVQLSERGLPILGDRKYGSAAVLTARDGGRRIALHARQLIFTHPTRGEAISVVAPLSADWPGSWS
jgi:23S rRNA pseudouridine1911/1915/1917 synthase